MKAGLYSFALALLLLTISSAKAVPVYGTITGTVTSVTGENGYPPFGAGTPVTGSYEYTPSLLIGGSTEFQDPTAYYLLYIDGYEFLFPDGLLNMTVGADGEPVSGRGATSWDLFLGSTAPGTGTVSMNAEGIDFIDAEVTYSSPSTTIPDTASTSCLAGIAMLGLAVFGRFTSQFRKVQPSAR